MNWLLTIEREDAPSEGPPAPVLDDGLLRPVGGPEYLLCTAAFDRPERACEAWIRWWNQCAGLIGRQESRLLPAVSSHLRGQDVPGSRELRRFYDHYRALGEGHLERAGEVLTALNDAGLEPILLKGLAMIVTCYEDPALRPMADVDVLVEPGQMLRAGRALATLGYRLQSRELHAHTYRDNQRRKVDLHHHSLKECRWPEADEGFQARAQPVELGGARARVLAPGDQLLHLWVHGSRSLGCVWLPDSLALAGSTVEWDLVAEEAVRRRVVMQCRGIVQFLEDHFSFWPRGGAAALWRAPVPPGDRLLFALRRSQVRGTRLLWEWVHELRARRPANLWRALALVPGFLRSYPG